MGARRLAWSRVVAVGPHARSVQVGDRVLFDPEDKAEVEVHGDVYVVMRERDVHAVAADRLATRPPASTSDARARTVTRPAQALSRVMLRHRLDRPARRRRPAARWPAPSSRAVGRPGSPAAQRRRPAERSKPKYEATIRSPSTASRTSRPTTSGRSATAAATPPRRSSICTLADTLITGARPALSVVRARRALRRPGHARGLQPAGRRVRDRPAQPQGRREAARVARPAPASRPAQMVRGYVAGVNKWLRSNKVDRPGLQGRQVPQAERRPSSTSGTASTWPTCSPAVACSSRRSSPPRRRA